MSGVSFNTVSSLNTVLSDQNIQESTGPLVTRTVEEITSDQAKQWLSEAQNHCLNGKYDRALKLANQGVGWKGVIEDKVLLAFYDCMGKAYYKKGMYNETIEAAKQGIDLAGKDEAKALTRFYEYQVKAFYKNEMYDQAIEAAKQGIDLAGKNEDADNLKMFYDCMAKAHAGKAKVCIKQGMYDEAIKVANQGIAFVGKDDEKALTRFYGYQAKAFYKKGLIGDKREAIFEGINQAFALKDKIKDKDLLVAIVLHKAQCIKVEEKFDEAIKLANEGLDLCKDITDKTLDASFLAIKGESHIGLKQYDKAVEAFDQGITLGDRIKDKNLLEILRKFRSKTHKKIQIQSLNTESKTST